LSIFRKSVKFYNTGPLIFDIQVGREWWVGWGGVGTITLLYGEDSVHLTLYQQMPEFLIETVLND